MSRSVCSERFKSGEYVSRELLNPKIQGKEKYLVNYCPGRYSASDILNPKIVNLKKVFSEFRS